MGLADGGYTFGPESGQLLVKTGRTGLGARAGHDLTIEVTAWRAEATFDSMDVARSSVSVEADAGSLEVRGGTGGVKPLTGADRAEINKTIRDQILRTGQYPTITFQSTQVTGTPGSFRIDGDLTITGRTQPVTVHARLTGDRVQGTAAVKQTRWGIRPYTAFLGALKLSDDVTVEFSIRISPGS